MDRKEFWSTKNPGPQYQTITFTHPAFDAAIRLVSDVFEPVTLGGAVCQPAPMTIKPPDQTGDATAKLAIGFPRNVVGREFKRQLRLLRASGSRAPITVYYDIYLGEVDAPKVRWVLYVAEANGITFNGTTVQVNATLDNPLRRSAALIYDPAVFTGLELL
ncbi:hypothetical protein BH10PSE18_BH10PSE18_08390 [soil metagenome]